MAPEKSARECGSVRVDCPRSKAPLRASYAASICPRTASRALAGASVSLPPARSCLPLEREPSSVTPPNTSASHGSGSLEYMATVRRASTPLNSPVTL